MPIVHATDRFEIEVDDKDPNRVYVRHKENITVALTLRVTTEHEGDRNTLVIQRDTAPPTEPIDSKMEIGTYRGIPVILIVPGDK